MIRSTSKFLLLLLLFSRLSQTLLASTPFPVGSIHNGDSLGRYLMLFKDESAELTAEQVATRLPEFTLSQADSPNWQVSSARTWAYFQINNPLDVEQTLYLENNYAQTDFISLYSLSQARISLLDRLGDHLPFANRQFFYRNAVFTMKLKPGLNEYLVSVQTTGTNLMPFKIWTPKAFHLKAPAENLFIGVAFGLVIFMVIYNFFIFVSLRSLSTLYYVAYGLCFIVMQISFQGVSGFVFENFPLQFWLNNWGFVVGAYGSNLFGILFSLRFLDLEHRLPRVYRLMIPVCWIFGVVFAAAIFQVNHHLLNILLKFVITFSTVNFLMIGIYFSLKKYRPAYFYTLAWGFVLVGSLTLVLAALGAIPFNFFTSNSLLIGGCLEMSLLSFAMADRIRHLREKRIQERELYIQDLMQKDQETQHSYEQLAKIVYPHQISLMRQGMNLEDTMKTGHSTATVIVFDVIGSTKFQAENKQHFFQNVFTSCYERMMRHDDKGQQLGEAYRIKELGDGFMCSVGFPFAIEDRIDCNSTALALSLDFIAIFNRIRREMYPDQENCYCSIGIAQGNVCGFYPIAGVRAYDLYGEALVLATRYEGLRRVLFTEARANILTAQASFVEHLSTAEQGRFLRHDLNRMKDFQIRNDPSAKTFYSMFVNENNETNSEDK